MKTWVSIGAVACAFLQSGCASIDRPSIAFRDSPNDKTLERVYAWTPGVAAAIGIDQFDGIDEKGHAKSNGVKFCVLTAATARTAATSAGGSFEAPTLKLAKAEGHFDQSLGALILKNESAAATFLDVGMFHLCMMSANSNGLTKEELKALTVDLFKSAVAVSKSSIQWAPVAAVEASKSNPSSTATQKEGTSDKDTSSDSVAKQ